MDREGFKNRMSLYREARAVLPLLSYWEWRQKYDAAPKPDTMPDQPLADVPTLQVEPAEDRAHRWDNEHYVGQVNTVFDADRHRSWKEPALKTFGNRVKFTYRDFMKPADVKHMNFLKSIGRLGSALKGASIFGEVVQNLFPSEEAETYENWRSWAEKQNKQLTGLEPLPVYAQGGVTENGEDEKETAIPTQEEYIAQQIAAEKEAALKKSYDRMYPSVPTSGGRLSEEEWLKNLDYLEKQLLEMINTPGKLPIIYKNLQDNLNNVRAQRQSGYESYIGEGKILGPSCARTTGDNWGINCVGSEQFRQNHENYGFHEVPYDQVEPSDIVLDYDPEKQRATHTMMFSKKGKDGVARFNHSNGGHTAEAIRKDARYPFKGIPLAYEFVGTPADSTQWINDYKKLYGYDEGTDLEIRQNR